MKTIKKYTQLSALILLLITFNSCQPKTVEKNGGLVINIDIQSNNINDDDCDAAIKILESRFNYFSENGSVVKLNKDNKSIEVQLPLATDSILYRNLIENKGNLEILETYDNKEIFKYLQQINDVLLDEQYNFLNKQYDSLRYNSDKAREAARKNPLFRMLSPAISNKNYLTDGPIIGYVSRKDTAAVNSILQNKNILAKFPEGFGCSWSASAYNDSIYSLIALRKKGNYKPITSIMIADANSMKDNANYQVQFSLKPEYNSVWADMTKNNIGNSVAIIIDNQVFSFPVVNSEISGGNATISSKMTSQEANKLAVILKYGSLPFILKIKQITKISI